MAAHDEGEEGNRTVQESGGPVDDRLDRGVGGADDLGVGDQGAQPVEGINDLGPRDAREEILVAPGETDHLVREDRPDDEQPVVIEDATVDLHRDRLGVKATGKRGHLAGLDSADLGQYLRVLPVMVEDFRIREKPLPLGRRQLQVRFDFGLGHRGMGAERQQEIQPAALLPEGLGQGAEGQRDGRGTGTVGDDGQDPAAQQPLAFQSLQQPILQLKLTQRADLFHVGFQLSLWADNPGPTAVIVTKIRPPHLTDTGCEHAVCRLFWIILSQST
ncbi:MAG: hypothetical protein BWY73_01449 [candidate division TA06 bacterium ADurb.Bin417]|uniref:Uncharacterized protein n=1 Tax=candidate division TA06 bacterium ADurb.Bin417 TaxID=1852828 RepID=A0A1V5M924_UNCT6|nr:MAG: hypothetical protein BWY73_01449 [candidate division TA06 bacterium ADurb.Bin417]